MKQTGESFQLTLSALIWLLLLAKGLLQAQTCAQFPAGIIPFQRVYYLSEVNANGDRLVVGVLSPLILSQFPLPSSVNQRFCGQVELAPGLLVEAYVPSAEERRGVFAEFDGLLLDPSTNQPFPGGIIPINRLGDPNAWRIFSSVPGQPPPQIKQLAPTSAFEGDPSFHLTVFGNDFTERSVVLWNGSPRVTEFLRNTQLVAAIPTSDITSPGSFPVSVADGDLRSDSLPFRVNVNDLPPALTGVSPAFISTQGNTRVHILGRNFKPEMVQTTQFLIGGKPVTGLTFVNSTQLDAIAPANPEGVSEVTMASFTGPQGGHSLRSAAEQDSEVGLIYRPFPPVPPTKPGYLRQRIPLVIDTAQFRTNLGINNLGGSSAVVEILMADNNGGLVADRKSVAVPAHGMTQVCNIVRFLEAGSPMSECGPQVNPLGRESYLLLESPAENAFTVWASQIDNVTNDPSIEQSRTESVAGNRIILPTSASLNQFRTSLIVVNNSPSAGQVQIRSYNAASGAVQASLVRSISAYGFLSFSDFYEEAGKSDVFGPIVVEATGSFKIMASARIYTEVLTSGYLEGVDFNGASEEVLLPYSVDNLDFRTNVGITNPGENSVNVTIQLINMNGDVVGSLVRIVPPHGMVQVNNINQSLSNGSTTANLEGYLRVGADQPVFAWSSQIDNQTQDTSMVVGKPSTVSTSSELLIPSITRLGSFVSTLAVVNLDDTQTEIKITALDSGGNLAGTSQLVVAPHGFLSYTDILASLSLVNVFGPLEIRSLDGAPLLAVSRVYSTQRTGGYFEGIPLTP